MRRVLLVAAAGVVLVANGWGLLQALRNQRSPRGGTLELTERELRLLPMTAESTATVLRLNWNVSGAGDEEEDSPPGWLDTNRLANLGFDCSVPINSPQARRHYTSMPSRPVYLAVEYEGDAWRNAGAKAQARSHLFVVDTASEAQRLRERYPDPRRHLVCRGLVRLMFRERDRNGNALSTPRVEGWVEALRPSMVFVPLQHARVLRGLSRPGFDEPAMRSPREPRFAVRVSWGANYEPRVEAVRLLNQTQGGKRRAQGARRKAQGAKRKAQGAGRKRGQGEGGQGAGQGGEGTS